MSLTNLKEAFESKLSPSNQTKVKKYGIITLVLILGVWYYYSSGRGEAKTNKSEYVAPVEVVFDESLMESDLRDTLAQQMAEKDKASELRLKQLEDQREELMALMEAMKNPTEVSVDSTNNNVPAIGGSTPFGGQNIEYPRASQSVQYFENSNVQNQDSLPQEAPHFVGGIGFSAGAQPLKEEVPTPKKNLIRLPPSFMKASLLVGIDAMTSQMGESNPETIILRVQAPAVLPNKVKQNLEGCFIVADAYGNLAKERVQVRLVSLHCNSTDGKAVIDQKIKGFVADTDGKRDLAGIVVSKAGANMARLALASVFGAGGTALGGVGTSIVSTATSTATSVDPNKVLIGAAAQGLGSGASELSSIYSDLVKQSTPTIEVGAAKKLMVIIQEKVDLEIKVYD